MKVVINCCYGGFGYSREAADFMGVRVGSIVERTDPRLIAAVEALGSRANDTYSDLKVVEIPDDVQWYIEEYDGNESIHEEHRIWS